MSQSIDPKTLYQRIQKGEKIRIIDVRTPLEFNSCHAEGAENLPLSSLGDSLPGVGASEPVAIICQSGMRSSQACAKVMGAHKGALNVSGGTSAWVAAGLPFAKAEVKPPSLDRQAHIVAGTLLTAALVLHFNVAAGWIWLAALPAFGLLLDGLTGICPVRILLKQMPWNRSLAAS